MGEMSDWTEGARRPIGLYLSPPGHGGQTFTYACVLWEVCEYKDVGLAKDTP